MSLEYLQAALIRDHPALEKLEILGSIFSFAFEDVQRLPLRLPEDRLVS